MKNSQKWMTATGLTLIMAFAFGMTFTGASQEPTSSYETAMLKAALCQSQYYEVEMKWAYDRRRRPQAIPVIAYCREAKETLLRVLDTIDQEND